MQKRPLITANKIVRKPAETKRRPQAPARETSVAPRLELKPDSLAFSLLGAAKAVALVNGGNALPLALTRVFAQMNPLPQARGAIQDIAYRTMRQLGMAENLLSQMTSKAPEPADLLGLLSCALSLLLHPADLDDGKT